jgi:hypothetical protein
MWIDEVNCYTMLCKFEKKKNYINIQKRFKYAKIFNGSLRDVCKLCI